MNAYHKWFLCSAHNDVFKKKILKKNHQSMKLYYVFALSPFLPSFTILHILMKNFVTFGYHFINFWDLNKCHDVGQRIFLLPHLLAPRTRPNNSPALQICLPLLRKRNAIISKGSPRPPPPSPAPRSCSQYIIKFNRSPVLASRRSPKLLNILQYRVQEHLIS